MRNYLLKLDKTLLKIVKEVGKKAHLKKYKAYIVGGVVRDIILGHKNLDLDIVVEGDAVSLAKALARKYKGKVTAYNAFGTASLRISGDLSIDFSTARKERYPSPGALPVVRRGDLREDLLRRDFTINTMAIAINPECFGELIDRFGGLSDLSKKRIKVLHDRSFIDDPTRILRAVRFEQRFSFGMDRNTLLLIKEALRANAVSSVKPPRYFSEFRKMLHEENPLRCFKRLHQWEALCFLDPRFKMPKNLNLLHQRIWKIRRQSFYDGKEWGLVYFMGLIANCPPKVVEDILTRFAFTKNERMSIRQSLEVPRILKELSVSDLRPSQVFQILRFLTEETVLYLRVLSSHPVVTRHIDRFFFQDRQVKLFINGNDLKTMGISSGSALGKILEDILCLKIDGKISTKQEELRASSACLGGFNS